jgi:hypothetical protein
MPEEAVLVGGPQDGASVKGVGGHLPDKVYVGPHWLGDGFAAWSREYSKRFPVCYANDGQGNFRFRSHK